MVESYWFGFFNACRYLNQLLGIRIYKGFKSEVKKIQLKLKIMGFDDLFENRHRNNRNHREHDSHPNFRGSHDSHNSDHRFNEHSFYRDNDDFYQRNDQHFSHQNNQNSYHRNDNNLYQRSNHFNLATILEKLKGNNKLKLFVIGGGLLLIVIVIILLVALLPLIIKLFSYIGQHGLQGIIDSATGFIEKILKGSAE